MERIQYYSFRNRVSYLAKHSSELGLAKDERFNEMNVSWIPHLHLSTLLIIGWTATALLLIVTPGEVDDRYYARDFQLHVHGWPWVHLYRFVPKPDSQGEGSVRLEALLTSYRNLGHPFPMKPVSGGRFWTKIGNWTFWIGMLVPNWMCCLFNTLTKVSSYSVKRYSYSTVV